MNDTGDKRLSRTSLIGLVIGSMIGGGAFNIQSDSNYNWMVDYCYWNDFFSTCLSKLN